MTLLPQDKLDHLILHHAELTQERRQFLVEFLQDSKPDEVEWLMENHSLPSDEFAFVRACFGVTDDTRPLPRLTPTERSL